MHVLPLDLRIDDIMYRYYFYYYYYYYYYYYCYHYFYRTKKTSRAKQGRA